MSNPDELDNDLGYESSNDLLKDETISNEETLAAAIDLPPSPAVEASKKRKLNDKSVNKKKQKIEQDFSEKTALATQSTDRILDYFASKIRAANPDLSPLELSDLYLQKSTIKFTGFWKNPRNLDGLKDFISENFAKYLPKETPKGKSKKAKTKESTSDEPRKFIVVLSMSALRACDTHRATAGLPGSSVKLISKNKLKNDLKLLQSTRSRILCTTPQRLMKILTQEDSPLKLEEIKTVIADSTYLDNKKRFLWDTEEVFPSVTQFTSKGAKLHLY